MFALIKFSGSVQKMTEAQMIETQTLKSTTQFKDVDSWLAWHSLAYVFGGG